MKQTNFLRVAGIIFIILGIIGIFIFIIPLWLILVHWSWDRAGVYGMLAFLLSVVLIYIGWNVFKRTNKAWIYAIIFLIFSAIISEFLSSIKGEDFSLLIWMILLFLVPLLYLGRNEKPKGVNEIKYLEKGSAFIIIGKFFIIAPIIISLILGLRYILLVIKVGLEEFRDWWGPYAGNELVFWIMLLVITPVSIIIGAILLLTGKGIREEYLEHQNPKT